MKFAVWLRAVIDALMRTPYVRSLEQQVEDQRKDFQQRLGSRADYYGHEKDAAELQLQQLRVDLTERIRDKDAVISDLRVRLAVAETDVVREQLAKQPRPAKPVPAFEGPVSFQDELAQMDLKAEETEQ